MTPRSRDGRASDGFSLVEVMIAGIIAATILASASVALTATAQASRDESTQGATTNTALVAVQAIQLELSGGWATPTNVAGITSSCTDGDAGGTAAFVPGNGPFVSATSTSIMFCGFRNSSTTSYTYDIFFTACNASNICTLAIDREPGFHCSVCTPSRIFAMAGVSDAPSGSPATGPFTYWYYDAAASTPPTGSPPAPSARSRRSRSRSP